MWPNQGVLIFAMMSAVPPLIAILRRNAFAFAGCLPLSVLAWLLASYTYLVPIAAILLIFSFVLASRKFKPGHERTVRWVRAALLSSPFVAIGVWALWLTCAYNWSPPRMLEGSISQPSSDRDQAMTESLNSQFPAGIDETILKSELLKQGFEDAPKPRLFCRLPEGMPGWRSYGRCPEGTREVQYYFRTIVCSYHIIVNWSADRDGKVTGLEGTEQASCL
jgi:hypothetical protein